jgi:hypothetical protein
MLNICFFSPFSLTTAHDHYTISLLHPILFLWQFLILRDILVTILCVKVCQWLATGQWFSLDTLVTTTNKTDCHELNLEWLIHIKIYQSLMKNKRENPSKFVQVFDQSFLLTLSKIDQKLCPNFLWRSFW